MPERLLLTRDGDGRVVVPAGAVRVDRYPWRNPFPVDHQYIGILATSRPYKRAGDARRWARVLMYAQWLDGTLTTGATWQFFVRSQKAPPPPPAVQIEKLRGKHLADWPALGLPSIGDVLLARANRQADGSLYPTASDGYRPAERQLSPRERWDRSRSRVQGAW